jgi:hypothetical protein
MNYVRTSAGGMMPIFFKTNTLNADKKQTVIVKPIKKSKKNSSAKSK